MVIGTHVPMTESRNLQLFFAPSRRGESKIAQRETLGKPRFIIRAP